LPLVPSRLLELLAPLLLRQELLVLLELLPPRRESLRLELQLEFQLLLFSNTENNH
jgi:hypothetical protein